jgi:hypothetical protein
MPLPTFAHAPKINGRRERSEWGLPGMLTTVTK